jgi:hypothetical protein
MRVRNSIAVLMVAAAFLIPSAATAEAGEAAWSSDKPWWVNETVNVAQLWSNANTYSGHSKHGCSNSSGWYHLNDLNCAD